MENQNESVNISTDNSIDSFINEVKAPTTPALGTNPASEPVAPVYENPIPSAAPPPPPPRNPDDPIFRSDDLEETEPETKQPVSRSEAYENTVIRGLIVAEEYLSSRICAIAAGTSDPKPFTYTEDDKDTIQVLLEPFKPWLLAKCPAAVPLLLVYGGIKTDQIMKARKIAKTIKENEAARTSPAVVEKIKEAAAGQENKPRTRWTINKKGEYTYDRFGRYVSVGEEKELASIADLEQIVGANKLSIVMEAFKISEADIKARGIEID